ncbi:MAG: hypothetical protein E6J01_02475 [Chloroflexi bacterium]|nr:MAG: hypothetical protein E6J01_02475 [Chloroflexota bacterium]
MSRRRRPIFSWVSEPTSASLANFVVATLVLGGLFAIGFLLSRDQRSGSLFLVVALICLGVGVVFAAVAGLEQVGTALLRRSGRSGREAAVAGLLAICLLVPWSVAIRAARAAEVQGWKNPVAWVAVIAIGVPLLTRSRRWMVRGLAVGGAALAGWLIWVSLQLTGSTFGALSFPFLPIDLLGVGWYAALAAWVVVVDALATEMADDPAPRAEDVWPFAVVPGLGIARLGLVARGRLYLIGAALLLILIQGDAYAPQQFAFFGGEGGLPEPRSRLPAAAATAALLIVYAGSLWDTQRMLQRLRRQAAKLRVLRGGPRED